MLASQARSWRFGGDSTATISWVAKVAWASTMTLALCILRCDKPLTMVDTVLGGSCWTRATYNSFHTTRVGPVTPIFSLRFSFGIVSRIILGTIRNNFPDPGWDAIKFTVFGCEFIVSSLLSIIFAYSVPMLLTCTLLPARAIRIS